MKKHKLDSVSFPAISTGIFRFPLEKCGMIIGEVLKEAIDSDPDLYQNKKLIICNVDEKTTKKMEEYVLKSFSKTGKQLYKIQFQRVF